MRIIISNSFEYMLMKLGNRYGFTVEDFVDSLSKKSLITLQSPFFKIKLYVNGQSLRGIVYKKKNTIIPLFLVTKNHRLGKNLILSKDIKKQVQRLFEIYGKEISLGQAKIYDY